MLLAIEKLIYGGDGLARLPLPEGDAKNRGRGKAIFLPYVLEGEKIEASLLEEKSGFARGRLDTLIAPSSQRVPPACRYFEQCGGCHYQHASYEHQLAIKEQILRETLRRTSHIEAPASIEVHPSPPWNFRNRSRLQIRTGPKFAAGYFKPASHELQPVEECPISSPLINRALAGLWENGSAGKLPPGIAEVEFFANADDSRLLLEVYCSPEARRSAVRAWAEDFSDLMSGIVGIAALREQPHSTHSSEKLVSVGESHLSYTVRGKDYRVSAGSFFQTNRHLIERLTELVCRGQPGDIAMDLYAGVGLFSTALARDFRHIVSVEASQTSSADLAYNLASNGEAIQTTTEKYLAGDKAGHTGKGPAVPLKPDLAVVDPPRSGLGERVARSIANLGAPRVCYVSCDPTTLARDLSHLFAGGYRIEQMHLVDMFPQTYHIETVVHLTR
jgi:23S rRNA (uracil1939-C5)-methyltransferase